MNAQRHGTGLENFFTDKEEDNISLRRRPVVMSTEMIAKPRFDKQPTTPAVYKIKITKTEKNKTFSLVKDYDKLPEPPEFFGNLLKIVNRTWNTFKYLRENKKEKSFAVAAVGYKGMGKTDYISTLANKAIDFGMIVVMVDKVQTDIELVNFLSTLDNVFLVLDEFGKNFSYGLQEKMLTMFNNLEGKNRFIAITENRLSDISDLFLDRPGRIHYLIEFETTDNVTIEEFCNKNKISKKLTSEILESANKIPAFSFDFLKGILKEHEIYPDDSLEEMLQYLNIKKLLKNSYLDIVKIEKVEIDRRTKNIKSRVEHDFDFKDQVKEKAFKQGRYLYMSINGKKETAEEKAARLEKELKAKEESKDGKSGPNLGGYNPFMASRGESTRISFNLNQLEFIEKYPEGGAEYTVYGHSGYYITITYR